MPQPQPTPVPEPAGFDQWLDAMATELGITPPLDLDAIHSTSGAFAQCAAQESAEDVPALIAQVARLTARVAEENERAHRAEKRAGDALDVIEQHDDPSLCPDATVLITDLRAALNPQPAPTV
jgi:hypothetical protein